MCFGKEEENYKTIDTVANGRKLPKLVPLLDTDPYPEMPTPPNTTDHESGNDRSNISHALEENHVNSHPPSTLMEEVEILNHNCWQGLATAGGKGTDRSCSDKAVETLGVGTPNQSRKLQNRRNQEGWPCAKVQTERNPEKVLKKNISG